MPLPALFKPGHMRVGATVLETPPDAPGIYDIEANDDENGVFRYTLALPDGYQAGQQRPLVVVLHYAGQPTRFYGRPLLEMLFRPALSALGAILVAPESRGGQWHTAENEAFVMALVDGAHETYLVDLNRVVVGGYSMGALGCWHFIEHYPERFSAAVPVAGFPQRSIESPVPAYAVATESDEIFAYDAFRDAMNAAAARGQPVTFATAEARGHYDVNGFLPALAPVADWITGIWQQTSN